jgi:hypothetical protein
MIDGVKVPRKPFFKTAMQRVAVEHDEKTERLGRGVVEDGVEQFLVDGHLVGDDLSFARVVDLKEDEFGRVDANGSW